MKVLVTGGAGYIGSTTAKALEAAGHTPVILDNLLSGPRAFVRDRIFYEGDVADRQLLRRIMDEHPDIDCTIHMAARIVVPESVEKPYEYYRDNVTKSLELFDELTALGKPRVVFSSSASLYALVDGFAVDESSPLDPPSPYARTKRVMEMVLEDLSAATDLRAIILRYFNPIGSDPDLESGVYVREPSHVLGQLTMAAQGLKDAFTITGTEHPTRDGTGIRDYIHVWDLARAHVVAVEKFDQAIAARGQTEHRAEPRHRARRHGPRAGRRVRGGVRRGGPGQGGASPAGRRSRRLRQGGQGRTTSSVGGRNWISARASSLRSHGPASARRSWGTHEQLQPPRRLRHRPETPRHRQKPSERPPGPLACPHAGEEGCRMDVGGGGLCGGCDLGDPANGRRVGRKPALGSPDYVTAHGRGLVWTTCSPS